MRNISYDIRNVEWKLETAFEIRKLSSDISPEKSVIELLDGKIKLLH